MNFSDKEFEELSHNWPGNYEYYTHPRAPERIIWDCGFMISHF